MLSSINGKPGESHGQGAKQGGPQDATSTTYRSVLEAPAYLLNPQAQVSSNGKGQSALKLRDEETTHLYDGLQVFQEFTGDGSPLAEYMRGNDLVASRQTFGLHGRKDEGREGNPRTRGDLLYYGYDGLGSVTDLMDRTGDEAMQYRYDAFGGLYNTQHRWIRFGNHSA